MMLIIKTFCKIFGRRWEFDEWVNNAHAFVNSVCEKIKLSEKLEVQFDAVESSQQKNESKLEKLEIEKDSEADDSDLKFGLRKRKLESQKIKLIANLKNWSKNAFWKVDRFKENNPEVAEALRNAKSNSLTRLKESLEEIDKTNRVKKRVHHLIRELTDPNKPKEHQKIPEGLLFHYLSNSSLYTGKTKYNNLKRYIDDFTPGRVKGTKFNEGHQNIGKDSGEENDGIGLNFKFEKLSEKQLRVKLTENFWKKRGIVFSSRRAREDSGSPARTETQDKRDSSNRKIVKYKANRDSSPPTSPTLDNINKIQSHRFETGSSSGTNPRDMRNSAMIIKSIVRRKDEHIKTIDSAFDSSQGQNSPTKKEKAPFRDTSYISSGFSENLITVNNNFNYYFGNLKRNKEMRKADQTTVRRKIMKDYSNCGNAGGKKNPYLSRTHFVRQEPVNNNDRSVI